MISLQESWQQQREQRQQEVGQRQQQVQEMLSQLQQARHMQSVQLRQDLHTFQQQLKQHTQDFLSTCVADRLLMTQQLSQDLSNFRQQLHDSVAALCQQSQTQIQQRQTEVKAQLQTYQQDRLETQLQLMQDLTNYVEALRSEVQAQLVEFGLTRQEQAQQLRQMLRENGDRRRAEVAELFQQLTEFRCELRAYRSDLQQLIWGNNVTSASKTVTAEIIPPVPSAPAKSSVEEPAAPKPLPKTDVKLIAKVLQPTAATVNKISEASTTPPQEHAVSIEESVYNYILAAQGARLNDIEAALKINRFQAVDALRTLIRKGFVTQRDRIYLIQEDMHP